MYDFLILFIMDPNSHSSTLGRRKDDEEEVLINCLLDMSTER